MLRIAEGVRKGFTRRALVGGALAGAATMASITLVGCTGDDQDNKVTGKPQVITDDSKVVNVTEEYKEADTGMAEQYGWDLPLGSVPFHSEGSWAALMMAPESAREVNTLDIISIVSGNRFTLVEKPTQGSRYAFHDVRCSDSVFAWVEMDYAANSWVLIACELANGQLAGDPVKLDTGDKDWDPPRFTATGSSVIWQKMPSLTGSKTAEKSHCYHWSVGDSEGKDVWESVGRFASSPHVTEGILTIVPRVNNDDGTFYGITAVDLSDGNKMVDQLVMPETVSPFEAVYMGSSFAFSVEANYGSGGSLGNMGTFIGREGGPFVFLSREPLACVAGKGTRYLIKAQSSHFVIDTKAQTYGILTAPDKSLDYGDYPASEGTTDLFVTYATVRGDNGLPASVRMRVFPL